MAGQPMIVARGEATLEVPPELAVFSVGVSVRGAERDQVVSRLTSQANALRELVESYGSAIERRETSHVQVYPEFKKRGERPVAYTGNAGLTVTVSDFAVLGEMLPRLQGASLSGPWWQLRPGSKAGAEVRRTAVADALERAREYAAAVGARIDRLVEISDDGGHGGAGMMRAMAFPGGAPENGEVLQLDPQLQTVSASVVVRVTITEPDLS